MTAAKKSLPSNIKSINNGKTSHPLPQPAGSVAVQSGACDIIPGDLV
jgi:hypothetical protein